MYELSNVYVNLKVMPDYASLRHEFLEGRKLD